jgi:hypothetical protein
MLLMMSRKQARQDTGEDKRRTGEVGWELGSKGADSPRRGRRRGNEEASSTSSHEDRKPSRDSACDSPDLAQPGRSSDSRDARSDCDDSRQQRLDSASPSRDSDALRPSSAKVGERTSADSEDADDGASSAEGRRGRVGSNAYDSCALSHSCHDLVFFSLPRKYERRPAFGAFKARATLGRRMVKERRRRWKDLRKLKARRKAERFAARMAPLASTA